MLRKICAELNPFELFLYGVLQRAYFDILIPVTMRPHGSAMIVRFLFGRMGFGSIAMTTTLTYEETP